MIFDISMASGFIIALYLRGKLLCCQMIRNGKIIIGIGKNKIVFLLAVHYDTSGHRYYRW